jgi:hypothetical protein
MSTTVRATFSVFVVAAIALVLVVSAATASFLTPPDLSFGSFAVAESVAVDNSAAPSAGDVYVLDAATDTVQRFDAAGHPAPFAALGTVPGESNVIDGLPGEADETPQAGFAFPGEEGGFGALSQVAVDDSTGPTEADLYVTDTAHDVLDVFAPDGTYRGQLTEAAGEVLGEITGVAVDPRDGAVYIADRTNDRIDKFVPDGVENAPTDANYASSIAAVPSGHFGVTELAVDSQGDLYQAVSGGKEVFRYGPAGEPLPPVSLGADETACAIAVDPADDNLLVSESPELLGAISGCGELVEYDAAGTDLGTTSLSGSTFGLGVAAATGDVYLGDRSSTQVDRYSPPPPVPPTIDSTSAVKVTATGADLQAQVNPNHFDTHAHFEYITEVAYQEDHEEFGPGAGSTPVLDLGSVGANAINSYECGPLEAEGKTCVVDPLTTAHLSGLSGSTLYRYRLIAENGNGGPQVGPTATLLTRSAVPLGPPQNCPNAPLRTGFSAVLPDCRAYEKISPLDKNGGEIRGIDGLSAGGVVEAAADGRRVTYVSTASFGEAEGAEPQGAPIGSQYLSTRNPDGSWSLQNLSAGTTAAAYALVGLGAPFKAFSDDLSEALMENGGAPVSTPTPAGIEAPPGYQNFYLHDSGTDSFDGAVLTAVPKGADGVLLQPGEFELKLLVTTPDLSHAIVETCAGLTPEAVVEGSPCLGENLYEWSAAEDALQPVNVLPGVAGGETAPHAFLGNASSDQSAVSADGSRVVFSHKTNGLPQKLFERVGIGTPAAHTVRLDRPFGESGETGDQGSGAIFDFASADGSRVFFTAGADNRLTADTVAGNGENLYEYDLDAPEGERLTDLTAAESAAVVGVLGGSPDGSYLYFVAEGALAGSAIAGPESGCVRKLPGARCNLYVSHEGTLRFLGDLAPTDSHDWATAEAERPVRISADGALLLPTAAALTGYDSRPAGGGRCSRTAAGPGESETTPNCEELYLFDPTAGIQDQLRCISCNPSGARPLGSSGIPAGTHFRLAFSTYSSRLLFSAAGAPTRVFFDSSDALVPTDTNGAEDVYEWEARGTGSCHSEGENGGCLSLISGGSDPGASRFVDADQSGENVFFVTGQQLVPSDTDTLVDLYDARVEGGQVPGVAAAAACEGDACHSPPAAPDHPTPATSTSLGAGNHEPKSCPKGKVRQKGKCVPKKSSKKKHHQQKKHHKGKGHTKQKRAGTDRGGHK